MKFIIITSFLVLSGLLFNPTFAQAGSCYVDEDASSGGDGSKEEPYTKISKAIDEGCKDIDIENGTYSNNITLGKGVEIKGNSRDKVIITGKVTMKDGSEIEKVGIYGKGVDVSKNASVKITNVRIKDARIGIETYGGGKLTLEKSRITGNRKGLYLQMGKNVSIKSSVISSNSEEGIDIRSNVDGVISGNVIERNGESGIEVILGKSELSISGNKIKNNRSSGIATQFYSFVEKIGGIKISNNTISGNKNFAIDCKVPSGGSPSVGYWSNSIYLINNSIYDNNAGDFAPRCGFGNIKARNATRTEEEIDASNQSILLAQAEKEESISEESDAVVIQSEEDILNKIKENIVVTESSSVEISDTIQYENNELIISEEMVIAIGAVGLSTALLAVLFPPLARRIFGERYFNFHPSRIEDKKVKES